MGTFGGGAAWITPPDFAPTRNLKSKYFLRLSVVQVVVEPVKVHAVFNFLNNAVKAQEVIYASPIIDAVILNDTLRGQQTVGRGDVVKVKCWIATHECHADQRLNAPD